MKTALRRTKARTALLMLAMMAFAAFLWFGCEKQPQTITAPKPEIARQQDPEAAKLSQDVNRVMTIQTIHTDALMAADGVVGTGTTRLPDGRYAVKIMTRDAAAGKGMPTYLDGVPVVVANTGEFYAQSYTGAYNPVPCGVSTGNTNECAAGTIGCVVTKTNGVNYFLSNNHVFARQNKAKIGEDIVQPGKYDAVPQCSGAVNTVADLSQFKPISFGLRGSNDIDAAIAQIRGTTYTAQMVNDGYFPGPGTAIATVGMSVKKTGRTTEVTTGTVTAINVSVYINYSSRIARFVNQIEFTNISGAGDSGSLIVTNNGINTPVALLFAGSSSSTIGNPIGRVLNYFGVTIRTSN